MKIQMDIFKNNNIAPDRRTFLSTGILFMTATGIGGGSFLTGCENKEEKEEKEEKEVSPPEDLMQEHGILKRILLIYDACQMHLMNKKTFPMEAISSSADIIRTFIEDYHEKQEEDYIFPRFRKANKLTDLVQVLLEQHNAGRKVTDEILQISKATNRREKENQRLIELLSMFNTMYNPHEAREDTVLFPAFRKIVSQHEYDSLGEEFEKNEHKKFGEDGFTSMVDKVASIEKQLGIYELSQFTPKI
ncbi:MAG: hemerythrin domain-containing protein [Sporocytophaga sp.]|uniref:hemerythrin domain-containing protein n=1 Tax=Sporocytophaga sp. TaxID=2231183 RepID=UPI001B18B325|nr:hemerythrin domain-containing protein [Sporocytophaga sp.]MBO9703302.1 hemerythrin domain-containing protein [Sporocytophaga sp.]